jgi:hypothetical protein
MYAERFTIEIQVSGYFFGLFVFSCGQAKQFLFSQRLGDTIQFVANSSSVDTLLSFVVFLAHGNRQE